LMVISSGDAISHSAQFDGSTGAEPTPFSASIAHLKVNGTDSVATFAINSSTTDHTTRIFRSARSPGQINGHRCTSVPTRVALSEELLAEGSAASACRCESGSAIGVAPRARWRTGRLQGIFGNLHMSVI